MEIMVEDGILLPYTGATVSLPLCADLSEAILACVGLVRAILPLLVF